MINLLLREITDPYVRENFSRIRDYVRLQHQLEGFKHYEITITGAQTHFKFPHNLGFQPKDVLVTSLTGAGSVSWNYDLFDRTNLNLSTTGSCVIRAFIGTYQEEQ
jgi:hypothetical protein